MSKHFILLLLGVFLVTFSGTLVAQKSGGEIIGIPWRGESGITVSVATMNELAKAAPQQKYKFRKLKKEEEIERGEIGNNPDAPAVSSWPPLTKEQRSALRTGLLSPQTVGTSFYATDINEGAGYVPPDVMGDVGPTQVLVHINGKIKVFNKSGTVGALNTDDLTFWSSVRNGVETCDPHVRYDRLSKRWFLTCINLPASGANRILIAVSNDSVVTSTSSFTFFQFQQNVPTPAGNSTYFADYPTLGVDANALYIGVNQFDGNTFAGSDGFVINKAHLLLGTLTVTAFRSLNDGSSAGPYTPQGVQNDDPSATEGYFIGVDNVSYSKLVLRRVSTPGGTPSISANINLTVPTTTSPIDQPAKGSTYALDAIDDRLYAAEIRLNRLTGVRSLWTAHNIQVNSSGVGSSSGGRNGSRWYEITNYTSTPTLRQSGTVYSTATTNPIGYWMPSVAMSGQGHMALGCSFASANDYTSIAVAGRYGTDVLGTTQSPTTALASTTSYNDGWGDIQRWGDYTQTVVDPTDDMTMWTFQEYVDTTNSWAVRVLQLKAPAPATPSSVSPSTVNTGESNVSLSLTGTSTSGTGFFDPGTGFTGRISASVSGTGVTVNSVTFTSPTSLTLNVTVAAGATAGTRTITVTNPDGQTATSATAILTVNNASCPTITLSPSTLPAGTAGNLYSQTISASGGTAPYTYTISLGTLPDSVTLTSGGLLSGTPQYGGTYSFTVQATDANSCTGTQAYSFEVSGCPQITVSPTTLPNGTISSAYSQTLTPSGGTSPYRFAVDSGSLPTNITLSLRGVLSGTPSGAGLSVFKISITDTNGCSIFQRYNLQIDAVTGNYVSLTASGVAYTQDFNTLAISGTSSTLPTGWLLSETGTNANTTYTAGTGSGTAGDMYSFGSSSSTERALGGLLSSSLVPSWGAGFVNNTGAAITSILVAYTGEQWRFGGNRTPLVPDTLKVQLSTDATSLSTGTWTKYDSLQFLSPVYSGTAAATDGNSSTYRRTKSYTISGLSISNGTTFFIRFYDSNPSGADDGLASDDFSLTPYTTAPTTNPGIAVSATPDTVDRGSATLLKATITPGGNPTSTGLAVTADLTTIGGSASQTFYDDGTNGDVTGGDNIFSFSATVPSGTTAGLKTLPFTVTDAQARTNSANLSLLVTIPGCATITLAPTTLPSAVVGTAYTQTITASGGTTPYTYAITSGSLNAGLTLDSTGLLSGTPTAGGTATFTVTATDSNACVGFQSYSITASCPTITVSPTTLPAGLTGTPYNQTITASGGTSPYTFAVTSGRLPSALLLASDGSISGTPDTAATYTFTITATDNYGCTGSKAYSVTFSTPAVTISLTTLGAPYTQNFDSLVSTGTSSVLPAGWYISESGANANSTYTAGTGASNTGDTYSYGDASSTERSLGSIRSSNLIPSWGAGFTNNTGSTITHMQIMYTGEQWRLGYTPRTAPDTLKVQLSTDAVNITTGTWTTYEGLAFYSPLLSGTIGPITGNDAGHRTTLTYTLTGVAIENGNSFFIRFLDADVANADDGLATDDFSITPDTGTPPPTNPLISASATPATVVLGSTTLLTATITPGYFPTSTGLAVAGDLSSIGGSATQTLYDDGTNGDVTPGDNIFSYTATVPSGTTTGLKSLLFTVTDAETRSNTKSINVTVTCPTITLAPTTLPGGTYNETYTQTITASGGFEPYTFAVTTGSLPQGLVLSSAGELTGTLEASGTAVFTVTATDDNGCTGTRSYSIAVACPTITVNPLSLPSDTTGKSYTQTITATGGKSPYTFSVTAGSLPDGLTLTEAGLLDGNLGLTGTSTFTLTATDSSGCIGSRAYTVTVYEAFVPPVVSIDDRWNIVSNPVIAANDSARVLFPTANSNPFAFASSGYQIETRLLNGAGYWLKFPEATTVTFHGTALLIDTVDVMLGWNMVGSISVPIAASNVTSIPPGIQTGDFFKYASGYSRADTLVPGKGYWVKVSQAGQLILASGTGLNSANRISIVPDNDLPPAPPSESGAGEFVPTAYSLEQNYPNPFNPTTNFRFTIAEPGLVSLRVFDVLGREVATLINQELQSGMYNIPWDAGKFQSGIYYYRLTAGSFSDTKKLVLMK